MSRPSKTSSTLDEIYLAKRALDRVGEALSSANRSGVDLIPCDKALSGVEYYLFTRPDREIVLSRFFDAIRTTTTSSSSTLLRASIS